jgi:beta-galactosidase
MFHRLHFVFWALLFAGIAGGSAQTMNAGERIVIPFDKDWQFFKGDGSGAEAIAFDDSHWQKVDTPHDWSIEGPFLATNSTGPAGAFLPAGIGWYRKHLALPASSATRRILVCELWIRAHRASCLWQM